MKTALHSCMQRGASLAEYQSQVAEVDCRYVEVMRRLRIVQLVTGQN